MKLLVYLFPIKVICGGVLVICNILGKYFIDFTFGDL